MVGKPTLRINAIQLSNGAKASDSKEKTYSPTESEALAPKKEQKAYFIGIGVGTGCELFTLCLHI